MVLSKAYRSVADRVAADIRKSGLNTTEFGVLELLYHSGDQPLQKIGDKILLASGSITYVVDKLEKSNILNALNVLKIDVLRLLQLLIRERNC